MERVRRTSGMTRFYSRPSDSEAPKIKPLIPHSTRPTASFQSSMKCKSISVVDARVMHDGRQPWLAVAVTKLVFSSNRTWNPRSTPPSPRSLALQGPTWNIRACAITTFGPTHANWPLVIFKIAGCPSTAQHHHQTQNLICARNSQFLAFKCYLNELKFPFSFSNRATSRWISLYFLFSNHNVTCFA